MSKNVRRAVVILLLLLSGAVVGKALADWPDCNPTTGECIP